MTPQISKSAIMSTTMRFLTAGGLSLALAVWREVARPHTDWPMVGEMLLAIILGVGGGAYGRALAQGPVTSVIRRPPAN